MSPQLGNAAETMSAAVPVIRLQCQSSNAPKCFKKGRPIDLPCVAARCGHENAVGARVMMPHRGNYLSGRTAYSCKMPEPMRILRQVAAPCAPCFFKTMDVSCWD
jgi:hypothetical protein